MKKYKMSFKGQIDVIVNALTEEEAFKICQKTTLLIAERDGVFLSPEGPVSIGPLDATSEQYVEAVMYKPQTLN